MDAEYREKIKFPSSYTFLVRFWLISKNLFIFAVQMINRIKYTLLLVLVGHLLPVPLIAQSIDNRKIDLFAGNIQWLGQATIRILTESNTIYIDPFRIVKPDQADIIFITHDHRDHYDPASISKLLIDETVVVAPLSCRDKINKMGITNIRFLSPWDSTEINGVHILAVPAYNIEKTNFHPKSKNYLGYVLTIDGIKVYHAGDTERIPEMQQFECDIAFLPLGQKYTMNSIDEAANAALDIKAKIAIPIHWGLFEGTLADAKLFQELLKGKVTVIIKSADMNQ